MVTQGATGDVNVRIQLDEGSIPDFGGRPPGPPTGGVGGAMPPEIMRMFAKDSAAQQGFAPMTQEQREQLSVLKQSMAIQKEAKEYQRYFSEDGKERKSLFENISGGIKESGAFQKIAASRAGQGAAKMLGGVSKLLGPLGMIAGGIGGMLLNTKVMKAGIGGLTSIISAFFDVLMAPLAPFIARGLQAMAKLIPWLQKFMDDPFGELGKLLEVAFNWMMDLPVKILAEWIDIPANWLAIWETVKEEWLDHFSGIFDAWGSLWDGVVALWNGNFHGVMEGFLGFFTGIASSWIGLFTGILQAWLDLFIDVAPDWMKPWLTTAKDWLENFDETAQDWLDKFPTVAADFLDMFKDTPGEFAKNWDETPDKWLNFWTDQPKFWNDLWDDTPQAWKDLFKHVPGLWLFGWDSTPTDWGKLWKDVKKDWMSWWKDESGNIDWGKLFPSFDWNLFTASLPATSADWAKIIGIDFSLMAEQLQFTEISERWGRSLKSQMDQFNAQMEGWGNIGAAVWDSIYGVAKSAWDWIVYYFQDALDNIWGVGHLIDTPTKPDSIADAIAKGWKGITEAKSSMDAEIKIIIDQAALTEQIIIDNKNAAKKNNKYEVEIGKYPPEWGMGNYLV